jgi:hypothetical protein
MENNYSRAFHSITRPFNFLKKLQHSIVMYCCILGTVIFSPNLISAQCPTPPGDQITYGNNVWIGYVYKDTGAVSPPANPFSATYIGYVVHTPTFQQNYGYDALYAPNVCNGAQNNFAVRYKMRKTYTAGYYTFTVGGDDGYRLSIDGGATFLISSWVDQSYTTSTSTSIYLDGQVDLVLEYFEGGGQSTISFMDSSCTDHSTAPTSISGPSTTCTGQSITLTAAGGTTASSGTIYEWGYGTTPGYYVISGQTSASLTIVPWGTDTIWVRRIDTGSCSNTTWGATTAITVVAPSTAPTTISGTTTICAGESTTLTASGGTLATGGVYQWGTGTVGSNVISGQTGASISVTPSSTTAYWVRRFDATCGFTTAITGTVTIAAPPGDPVAFGDNTWNMYAYSGADITLASATYAGYYSQNTIGFNTQSGTTAWDMSASPSSAAGWNGCIVPNDSFTFAHKRKGFPCGTYTLTMLTGDDACIVYIDGVQVFSCTNWSLCSNAIIGQFTLNENTEIEVRTREDGGGAHAALGLTLTSTASTAPTAISGTDTLCTGQGTTLTATGGTTGTNGIYQWGTGATVGTNIIAGQSGSSITVNPLATTTYWVCRTDTAPCPYSTSGITKTVTVETPPGNPAVFGDGQWNVYGYFNNDVSLTTTVYGGYYVENTVGFDTRSGTNSWAQTASASASAGWSGCALPSDNFTTVHKRKGFPCGNYTVTMLAWDDSCVILIDGIQQWSCANWSDTGSCNGLVGTFTLDEDSEIEVRTGEDIGNTFTALSLVNNTAMATAPTAISGTNVICSGTQTTLTATGGSSGTLSTYQWGTGTTVGSNIIAGQTSAVISINPTATTTYWTRRVNTLCGITTDGVTQTVIVPAAVTYSGGIWSGTPDQTTPIIIAENLTLPSDLHVCSCQVNNGATLIVPSTIALTVERNITINPSAIILVENNGSILQVDDSATNTGNISLKSKTSTMKQYDYNYWSSPVTGCTLQQLSPNTLFDKYFSFNPVINNWASHLYGAQIMEPGKGYIIRAPQGWSQTNATAGVYEGTFTGVPTNGTVSATVKKGAGSYNLIGNPYPSAIDLDLFLSDPANAGIINGTVYLWTHNTAISNLIPGNYIYNYTRDDYAKYNFTGGVRTASSAATGGARPTQKLLSGQGFFIEANTDLATGTYAATFKNSMRIENDANTTSRMTTNATPTIERHRIWVSLTNPAGAYDEMLLGYVSNATNGFDRIYDGRAFAGGNVVSIYSILGQDNLSIQGKGLPFDAADVIPLGYTTTLAGTFTISLDQFDGLFEEQEVYLTDMITGQTHALKSSGYSFTTESGTFNNRFELMFTNNMLGAEINNPATDLIVINQHKDISIQTVNSVIDSVEIFDLTGRLVYTRNGVNAIDFTVRELNIASQMLLVKVVLTDRSIVTKKIIID